MLNPIQDLMKIKELFKDVESFDPQKHTLANYIEKVKSKIEQLNKIISKYA